MSAEDRRRQLEQCLEDLERRIDPAVEDDLWRQWQEFTDGQFHGDLFRPTRSASAPPAVPWPEIRINEAQADEDAMLLSQYAACSKNLAAGNGAILCVRSNYGTGILSSLFGAELFIMDDAMNTLQTTKPLPNVAAIEAVVARGVPEVTAGLGARTLATGRRFREVARRFPKIGKYVHIYHPDLQGPMDIVELLWGSGLFLDIVDRPELVTALLERVTEAYLRFMDAWQAIVPPRDGHAVHWGSMHAGRILLRDDSAMNFSPETYDAFIRPYDQRLLERLGGGAVHFCGRGDHYIASCCRMEGLYAIAMSQPEYNDMERIFRHTVDRGIKLIQFSLPAAQAALARGRDLHGCVQCS